MTGDTSGVTLASYRATHRVQIVSPRAQGPDWSGAGLHHQPAYAGHQHSVTLFTARLDPATATSSNQEPSGELMTVHSLSPHLVHGIADRTESHAVVDSNIQAPSEVFSFSH